MKHLNIGDNLNSRFELLAFLGQGVFGNVQQYEREAENG